MDLSVPVPGIALGPDGVQFLRGRLVDVVLQADLEVVDVAGDRQELDDFHALAVRVAVVLAVLRDVPFAFPEDAAELVSFSVFCLTSCFVSCDCSLRRRGRN